MEDKQVMSIIEDADCDVETCFVNSHKGYTPCKWAKSLVETAYKAGQANGYKRGKAMKPDPDGDYLSLRTFGIRIKELLELSREGSK